MRKLFFSLSFLLLTVASQATVIAMIDTGGLAFADRHVMIITQKKEIRPGAVATAGEQTWKLMSSDEMTIFKNVKQITEAQWSAKFTDLPAYMTGKCRIDRSLNYIYELNAGGFLKLTNASEILYYGCFDKSLRKYFLKGPK
ncbi:MAG: hypothetical protein ABIT05_12695 [Chitinophagaceae bacterium]